MFIRSGLRRQTDVCLLPLTTTGCRPLARSPPRTPPSWPTLRLATFRTPPGRPTRRSATPRTAPAWQTAGGQAVTTPASGQSRTGLDQLPLGRLGRQDIDEGVRKASECLSSCWPAPRPVFQDAGLQRLWFRRHGWLPLVAMAIPLPSHSILHFGIVAASVFTAPWVTTA